MVKSPPSHPFIPLLLVIILLSYSFLSLMCFLYCASINLFHLLSLPNELEFPDWGDHNTTGPKLSSLSSCSIYLWPDPFSPPLIVVSVVLTPRVDPKEEQSGSVC